MISYAGRRSASFVMIGVLVVATGCASPDLGATSTAPVGLGCVDDSKQCLDQRAAALNALMSDKKRTWVRQPASPAAYASGVRMFAFKQKKRELSCEELALGRREAEAAAPTLRGPGGQGLTPAQVSRGVMFGQEVAKELANEQGRRCRA